MEWAVRIAQLILSLSILVVLHEWGHYITAKWFKMRVEKFYLFFNPKFSLFKKKIGETEWGVGWLPLGGYVKIAGMIDESMDKEQLKKAPQPWEFRSKPAWQRLIVMLGGVTVNAILAVLIFSGIFWYYGEKYMHTQDMKYGIDANKLAERAGLQDGDKIVAIDGKEAVSFPRDVSLGILFGDSLTIDRNGEIQTIAIPTILKKGMIKSKENPPINIRTLAIVGDVSDSMGAGKAGMKIGDQIIKLNGNDLAYFDELRDQLENQKNQEVEITYIRDGKPYTEVIKTNADGKLGIAPINPVTSPEIYAKEHPIQDKKYTIVESVKRGSTETVNTLVLQVKQIPLMFDKELEAYKEVGSFISISKMFSPQWNWQAFWTITAVLSIWLAFLNLLPIPGLDGGHAVFAIYEMISGRKPSHKFMEVVQTIGMVFLLTLMLVVVGWDFYKNSSFYKG